MMLIRSTYDYQLENEKRIATARLGVELNSQVYLPNTNEEVRVDTYHQVEATLQSAKERIGAPRVGKPDEDG
jgi:gamma-glutamylcysteine synthetase